MTEMTELIIKEKEEEQNRNHESIRESGFQKNQKLFGTDLPRNWFKGMGRLLRKRYYKHISKFSCCERNGKMV